TVEVKSEPGLGTCFTVLLPILQNVSGISNESSEKKQIIDHLLISEVQDEKILHSSGQRKNSSAPHILIVDDNKDLRQQIKRILSAQYNIDEAQNGIEGWERANALLPDLIISDVMMPGRDGLALCNQLKTDPATSHIPTILLSARIDSE